MFGLGPVEMVLFIPLVLLWLLPPIAAAVFLWLCVQGRFSAPKTCPHCGKSL
jgi:hypothetical protein